MNPVDQYPSTLDCATILNSGDDAVLRCLEIARERVTEGWTKSNYVELSSYGPKAKVRAVCAVGAILVASGSEETGVEGDSTDSRVESLDKILSDEAKEAISLLNEAALDLHPDLHLRDEQNDWADWSGPLEYINQQWRPPMSLVAASSSPESLIKAEIIRIYDHAIDERVADLETVPV